MFFQEIIHMAYQYRMSGMLYVPLRPPGNHPRGFFIAFPRVLAALLLPPI